MNYPLISEYIEAIKSAEDNFDELSYLRPVLNDEGLPVMTSGGFAVVFKMKDERTGKLYAVKCFLRDQEGRSESYKLIADELEYVSSNYLTPIKYLEKELFVDTDQSEENEFPVLLMDWVEGKTIDVYIKDNINNSYALEMLVFQFGKMASWLLTQPFAHGDLKPDNILINNDGILVLVDYDGMFVPKMKGQTARENGSPGFRHPCRTEKVFDEHIDDFSIASIMLSLKAIALNPTIWKQFGGNDRLLFCEDDFRDLTKSKCIAALQDLMSDSEFCTLYGIFMIAWAKNDISSVSYRLFNTEKSKKENISKYITYYLKAQELIEKEEYEEAFRLFSLIKKHGRKSSVLGLNGLGYMYAYGFYVSKDELKAFSVFKQASELGWSTAIFNLGICYEKGIGVKTDIKEANRLFHSAALKGFAPALELENLSFGNGGFNMPVSLQMALNNESHKKLTSMFIL